MLEGGAVAKYENSGYFVEDVDSFGGCGVFVWFGHREVARMLVGEVKTRRRGWRGWIYSPLEATGAATNGCTTTGDLRSRQLFKNSTLRRLQVKNK